MSETAMRVAWAGCRPLAPLAPLPARRRCAGPRRRLLEDRSFAARAGELAAWGREHDGAERGAELVEQLAPRPASSGLRKAPGVGLEPTTPRLTVECSTD